MSHNQHHNEPISEQFRLAAEKWVEAEKAASLMEETRTAVLSEMIAKVIGFNLAMPYNKAELAAKSSQEYREFVEKMVELRSAANYCKVQVDYLRMRFSEQSSHEATARAERRL